LASLESTRKRLAPGPAVGAQALHQALATKQGKVKGGGERREEMEWEGIGIG